MDTSVLWTSMSIAYADQKQDVDSMGDLILALHDLVMTSANLYRVFQPESSKPPIMRGCLFKLFNTAFKD